MPKENARELRKGKISRTIKGAIKISEHAKAVFTASMGMPLVAEKANDSIHCAKKPEPKAPAKKDPVPYIQKTVQRQETVFLLSQGDRIERALKKRNRRRFAKKLTTALFVIVPALGLAALSAYQIGQYVQCRDDARNARAGQAMEQGLNSRAVQQKPAHAKKAKAHARLTNAKKMAAHAKARVAPSPIMGQWTKERENKWAEICRENPALIAAIEGASPKDSEDAWKSSSTGADSMAGEANQSWESAFDGQQGARSLPEGISYPGSGDTVSVNIASLIGGDSRSLTLEFERNPDEISVSNSMSVKNCQLRIGKTSFTISAKKKGIFSKRAEIGIVQNDGEGHERSATLSIGKDGSLAGDPDELERIGIKAFRLN